MAPDPPLRDHLSAIAQPSLTSAQDPVAMEALPFVGSFASSAAAKPEPAAHESLSIARRTPPHSVDDHDSPLATLSANRPLRDTPNMSPRSRRSASTSPFRLPMPTISPGQLAFSTMQFLPVPILVLNNLKTVVLANDAMGRFLGQPSETTDSLDGGPTAMDMLRGQTLPQVGVDVLQDGRPVWVSWESLLDSMVHDQQTRRASEVPPYHVNPSDGDCTPTTNAVPKPSSGGDTNAGLGAHAASAAAAAAADGLAVPVSENPCQNSVLDVVVTTKTPRRTGKPRPKKSEHQVYAKMIVTIFEIDDNQTYFILTFTSTESPAPQPSPLRKSVARPSMSVLEAADRRTISYSNPSSACSSHDSNSPHYRVSPGAVSISSGPFPPYGPPSRAMLSSTPTLLQKMTTIKDALLDNTQMPILALWKDGTAPVLNAAAKDIFTDPSDVEGEAHNGLVLPRWDVFDEAFSRKFEMDEIPITVLLRTGRPFTDMRVGMYNKRKGTKVIYDVMGEVIKDPATGEMVAGVITCRDVTSMAQEITHIKEMDEERFELTCNTMPQMVWSATPDGLHDFFNNRWYDYTGLTPEESLGTGWRSPFHPDDIPAAQRNWQHSLATGDPYAVEYRCRRRDGEWRWMLGRALPLRNKHTGKIDKWYGTCTDVHESFQSKLAAKQMRRQLLSVLSHAQTTIFSVDRQSNVTMFEGALIWNGARQGTLDGLDDGPMDGSRYIGACVDDVFNDLSSEAGPGHIPAFLQPVREMLEGKRLREMVQEHEIGKLPPERPVDMLLTGPR